MGEQSKDRVVSLRGERIYQPGEPVPELVSLIEGMLERAKRGEIKCLIGTGWTSDGGRLSYRGGHHDNIYEMRGAIAFLDDEYVAWVKSVAPDAVKP